MKNLKLTLSLWIKTVSLVSVVSLNACSPAQQYSPPNLPNPPSIAKPPALKQTPIVIAQAPEQQRLASKLHKVNHAGISFSIVSFDAREYKLEVVDQPNGPGTLWTDARTVASKRNALVALNAGFFTPEGKPLGLVIDDGVKRGSYNASSLGKGIYYSNTSVTKLTRSSDWRNILKTNPKQLLQAGPMLVDNGISTKGLSTQNSRPRSFLATDGKNHWIMGHASSSTLSQLGKALDNLKIGDFVVKTALNLDGGRSSDLWVSSQITNGPTTIRPFWNKAVRNFLILKRK